MTTLRETTKKKILDALEKTYFTASSFSVQFHEGEAPFLVIGFVGDKRFKFSISEPPGYNTVGYITEEAPGVHIETGEKYKHENLSAALKAITSWVERIHEDYRSKNPIVDELESFRQMLADQIEHHVHDRDAHFSAEEANELRQKLDELGARLQQLAEKNDANERRLDEARQELEKIKADVAIFPKGVWYRVAGSKVLGIVKKVAGTAEGRQFALEAAKKLFLEGPK